MSEKQESKLVLELGQVIQIISPLNANLHEKIFLIEYLDDKLIKLVNEETTTEIRIIDGKLRPIDVAKVVADKIEYYSFNIIGWGLPADAANMAEGLRWLGGVRYNIASIIEVFLDRKKMATLIFDGMEYKEDFVGIIACNTIHTGKAMKMAPHAKIDDGKIDLLIVRKGSRLKLLKLFSKLFSGEHINNSLVEYKQVDRFSIIPDVQSKLNIDGELIGNSPVHVEVKKKRVNVLV